MDEIGKTQREQLLRFNTHLLKSNLLEPTALKNGMIPLDMDVTPMDNSNATKKEECPSPTKNSWAMLP